MLNKNSGNKLKAELLGGDALKLNINDGKAVLTMSYDGNITLKVDDNSTNILLGGKGGEQGLLTKKYHDQWAAKHIHSNGNMGSPTGPPVVPITPPSLVTRGGSNWHTVTLKGE